MPRTKLRSIRANKQKQKTIKKKTKQAAAKTKKLKAKPINDINTIKSEFNTAFLALYSMPTSYHETLFLEKLQHLRNILSNKEFALIKITSAILYVQEYLSDLGDKPIKFSLNNTLSSLNIETEEFIDVLNDIELAGDDYSEVYDYFGDLIDVTQNYTIQELVDKLAIAFGKSGRGM